MDAGAVGGGDAVNHRHHAKTLRNAAGELLRDHDTHPDVARLYAIAAELSHHRLILVPDVYRPTPVQAYLLIHTDADDNWKSLSMHPNKADAVKMRAKMRRHWARLRKDGVDV